MNFQKVKLLNFFVGLYWSLLASIDLNFQIIRIWKSNFHQNSPFEIQFSPKFNFLKSNFPKIHHFEIKNDFYVTFESSDFLLRTIETRRVPSFLRLFAIEIKMFCVVVYLLICYVSRLLISICWHLSRVTQSVTKKPFSVFLASADWLLLIVIVLIFLDPVNLEWRWVTKVVVTVAALGQLLQINANSPSDYRVKQQLLTILTKNTKNERVCKF